jgi:hypothetical protein
VSVEVAKEALELRDLVVANVVPDLEDGAMGPQITFGPPMATNTSANASRRRHANVDDLVPLSATAACGHLAIQHVDAPQTRRQAMNVVEWDVLEPAADQPERALWHVR